MKFLERFASIFLDDEEMEKKIEREKKEKKEKENYEKWKSDDIEISQTGTFHNYRNYRGDCREYMKWGEYERYRAHYLFVKRLYDVLEKTRLFSKTWFRNNLDKRFCYYLEEKYVNGECNIYFPANKNKDLHNLFFFKRYDVIVKIDEIFADAFIEDRLLDAKFYNCKFDDRYLTSYKKITDINFEEWEKEAEEEMKKV